MSMEHLLQAIRAFDGVLEVAPAAGSDAPEIAWGDHFFYYAPDGTIPERTQPYATIVTKNYPGDTLSDLDRPGRRRINVHVGKARFTELTGDEPRGGASARDFAETDVILPHPVYAAQAWIAVVDPGPRTTEVLVTLLRDAHEDARRRTVRRAAQRAEDGS